jgi:hypothetical protein
MATKWHKESVRESNSGGAYRRAISLAQPDGTLRAFLWQSLRS